MKTGRKDSKESYIAEVEDFIPNHNDSIPSVLSRFQSIGIDTEGTVALLGTHPLTPRILRRKYRVYIIIHVFILIFEILFVYKLTLYDSIVNAQNCPQM